MIAGFDEIGWREFLFGFGSKNGNGTRINDDVRRGFYVNVKRKPTFLLKAFSLRSSFVGSGHILNVRSHQRARRNKVWVHEKCGCKRSECGERG